MEKESGLEEEGREWGGGALRRLMQFLGKDRCCYQRTRCRKSPKVVEGGGIACFV